MTLKKHTFDVNTLCKCGVQIKIRQYNQLKLCYNCKKIKQKTDRIENYLINKDIILKRNAEYTKKNKVKVYKRQKDYREKNKVKIQIRLKNYYQVNKTMWRNNFLQKNYGITIKQFNEILKNQNNKCSICSKELDNTIKSGSNKPHLDHDHETGKVRAVLCADCNIAIGLFKENINIFPIAKDYLMSHKTDEQLEKIGIKGKAREIEETNRLSVSVQKEIERVTVEIKKSENAFNKWLKVLKEKARRYDLMRFESRKIGNKI
jgi:hypothetical protein